MIHLKFTHAAVVAGSAFVLYVFGVNKGEVNKKPGDDIVLQIAGRACLVSIGPTSLTCETERARGGHSLEGLNYK